MSCDFAVREALAERYVLGKLNEAEAERFEEHFFECDGCFEEVQTIRAVREALREMPLAVPARPASRWPIRTLSWAAVLLLGIGGGVSILWLSQESSRPAADAGAQRSAALRLADLAAIQPPPFTPARLRGAGQRGRDRFREAMALYGGGHFQAAIPGLIAASDADPADAGSRFFLGICFLMVNQSDRASEALRQTVALGDSPYLEEAHFYLGKALLRLNQVDGAREELRRAVGMHGDLEAPARGLLGELQKIAPAGGR